MSNPLTLLQKQLIVQELESGAETSYSLAKKLGCYPSYIRKIKTKIRRGIIPCEKAGRPPAIDEESLLKIRERIENRDIDRDEAVALLQQYYTETFQRRYPTKYEKLLASRKRLKIPAITRKRYLKSLFPNLVQYRSDDDALLVVIDRFDLEF